MKHVYTFRCPAFALQNALASGNQLPCWSSCTCLGLNLGSSPIHARNIYLHLNLTPGVSHLNITAALTNSSTQHVTVDLIFLAPPLTTISKLELCNRNYFCGATAIITQCYVHQELIWRYSFYKQTLYHATYVWHHIGWLQHLMLEIIEVRKLTISNPLADNLVGFMRLIKSRDM